ncbi:uncharacterized protein [Venturia canescens]|uniref:uncharacterized protein n=1 Tax=Venturia canescens TaxID=32260 RepID=UPI001C9CDFD9|nr:uncharacterized protein LOC122406096 [Venturia canescens]
MDQRLNWKAFIRDTKNKAQKAVNIIKILAKKSWGAHPSTLLTIYKGLIRARLEWAISCSSSASPNYFNSINTVQFAALRIILGCFRSTPTNTLLDLAKEKSMRFRAQLLTARYIARAQSFQGHPIIPKLKLLETYVKRGRVPAECLRFTIYRIWSKHKQHLESIKTYEISPCFSIPIVAQLSPININTSIGNIITTQNSNKQLNSLFEAKLIEKYNIDFKTNWTLIFTDGSKTKNADYVGAAFFIPETGARALFRLSKLATIFEAEASAIAEALKFMKNRLNKKNILIITDSLSVITALDYTGISAKSHPLIAEIKSLTYRISLTNRNVEFLWCPSHKGIEGNEVVDGLAKAAIEKGSVININLTPRTIAKELQKKILDEEQISMKVTFSNKGTLYYKYSNPNTNTPWWKDMSLERKSITLINRLRTGHIGVNNHLYRIGLVDYKECPCGHPEQSINHVFWECELNREHSDTLLGELIKLNVRPPLEIRSLSFSQSEKVLKAIKKFAEKIKDNTYLTY